MIRPSHLKKEVEEALRHAEEPWQPRTSIATRCGQLLDASQSA
jgi:hypothetical protein